MLGQIPEAPDDLLMSIEADVFPREKPDLAIQIDGAIGGLSPFHQTFGYYAHGVDETTATLPAGWQDRLVPVRNENTGGTMGWCLEIHDLAASKLAASCEKDLAFVRVLIREKMLKRDTLRQRCEELPLAAEQKTNLLAHVTNQG